MLSAKIFRVLCHDFPLVLRLGAPNHNLFFSTVRTHQRCLRSQATTVLCDMNKAYFRYNAGDDVFHVTLRVTDPEIGIDKQCNLCRRITETAQCFLNRIEVNVDKLLEKKLRKKKKKKTESSESGFIKPEVNASLQLNGLPVQPDFICGNFFEKKFAGNLCLKILNSDYDVSINSPWIESIALPENVMAGFQVYPAKLEGYFVDATTSDFIWFKSTEKNENALRNNKWEECGRGYFYLTTLEDVGRYLKLHCTPKNENSSGPMFEVVGSSPIEAGPGICPFDTRHLFTPEKLGDDHLRVVSYNILADTYAETATAKNVLFSYCPSYALNINYRKQLILKELLGYNADLICLQEVDSKVFKYDLVPILAQQNLIGEHSVKSKTMNEGTVCFYNSNKLKLLKSNQSFIGEEIDKNPLYSGIWEKVKRNESYTTRFQARNTVVQCVVLESIKKPSEILVVGNTHLYFHPDADHIRLLQGILAFMFLEQEMKQISEELPEKKVSLIMCGDFNSVPECGIYQFMTKGLVKEDCVDWKSNESEAVAGVSFSHTLKMASACGTPQYTNYTEGFKDCLDYIFYQTDRMNVNQIVPLPSEEELSLNIAIPSISFPSDHIALVADLQWRL